MSDIATIKENTLLRLAQAEGEIFTTIEIVRQIQREYEHVLSEINLKNDEFLAQFRLSKLSEFLATYFGVEVAVKYDLSIAAQTLLDILPELGLCTMEKHFNDCGSAKKSGWEDCKKYYGLQEKKIKTEIEFKGDKII